VFFVCISVDDNYEIINSNILKIIYGHYLRIIFPKSSEFGIFLFHHPRVNFNINNILPQISLYEKKTV